MSGKPLAIGRIRKNFGKIKKVVDIPNLIGVQRESYKRFLQIEVAPDKRKEEGLQAVFKSVFPIKDFIGSAYLDFVSYRFGETQETVKECISRGMTYEIPLYIKVMLGVFDIDPESGASKLRDIKEQEIYFGTIPLMSEKGTFIINGTERVVVSQLHRSSGVFFDHDKGKTHSSGKVIYSSRIIPVRGSWIDMEIDPKDIVYIRIDRRRKFPITLFFKAFGYTEEDILSYFYKTEEVIIKHSGVFKRFDPGILRGSRAEIDIEIPDTGESIVKKGRIFSRSIIKKLIESGIKEIPVNKDNIIDKVIARTIVNPETNEHVVKANETITAETLESLEEAGITNFKILYIDGVASSDSIRKTLMLDKVDSKEEAVIDIYRRMRPGNPATAEVAQDFIDNLFFKSNYYDLSNVGRLKVNQRLSINTSIELRTLRKEDILLTAKILVGLKDTQGTVDDIDHLGNRRVRAVGELLENQYRIGLVRMERAIKERMSLQEVDSLMPHDLVNAKPVSAVVREFFGTSQLSQFMDQTNPLSETTHKRRLSALGPGGLTRERAGFEVRDVHPSHYGRICPIETPEGPNIGLIVSLSTYAHVNSYGFIETPYRVVNNASVTEKVKFLSAFEERDYPIAQANTLMDEAGNYLDQMVTARVSGEYTIVKKEDVKLMDVSPNQLVSVSASLIPFLENDDANRALMGSNMQRQAVPLLYPEAPLVGTGMEEIVAKDSCVTVAARLDGIVQDIEASRIVVLNDDKDNPVTIYDLSKFIKSNQNTSFNQRPIVAKGDRVKAGQVIADGPATKDGELALGRNVTVAFMPWGGYNFEDSILIGERLHREGVYTSIHIEEFEVLARDTKLGHEEITRDIPNLGEEALKNLDESGIIRLGAEVKHGDILVGKITPKGETQLSPEEKLLRAIFGEKAGDVKDTSLRVPPGVEGIVIDAKVFARRGTAKDERTLQIENAELGILKKNIEDEVGIVTDIAREKLIELLSGKKCTEQVKRVPEEEKKEKNDKKGKKDKKEKKGKKEKKEKKEPEDILLLEAGTVFDSQIISSLPLRYIKTIVVEDSKTTEEVRDIVTKYQKYCNKCNKVYEDRENQYERGDDLQPGIIKMVKIYVAMKRKLSVGDKMAGRHGNKGVVSRILPQEDLPYFEDGTTVDMILNPLGVPSRMNVGQVLEIHLGYVAKELGEQLNRLAEEKRQQELKERLKKLFSDNDFDDMDEQKLYDFAKKNKDGVKMATPVFDGAKETEIKKLLEEAGLNKSGQTTLYDGRTGEPFKEKVTVGTMYVLKLHHLVDDKIHARSIGPYSLVTQQPLGGKAQFGGQRLGEMEGWAMEAYGAAYSLQEFLTVKSDDMPGRTRMYEKIVKGHTSLEPGLPESFNVLMKELQALGIDITLLEEAK